MQASPSLRPHALTPAASEQTNGQIHFCSWVLDEYYMIAFTKTIGFFQSRLFLFPPFRSGGNFMKGAECAV